MWRWQHLGVVCLLAGCSFEYSCGGKNTIPEEKLESQVRDQVAEQGLEVTGVECTVGEAQPIDGTQLSCTVEIEHEHRYPFRVTFSECTNHNCKIAVDVAVERALLGSRIEEMASEELTSMIGVPVAVDCREPIRSATPDSHVECDYTVEGFGDTVTVRLDEAPEGGGIHLGHEVVLRRLLVESLTEEHGAVVCDMPAVVLGPATVTCRTPTGEALVFDIDANADVTPREPA